MGLIKTATWTLILTLGLAFASCAFAQDIGTPDPETLNSALQPSYSPYARRNFPNRPLFGDTHLHTSFSMDAGAFGARLSPRDAYRFAKGEELTASSGQPVRLSRPLDFLVVADHSDNMGFFPDLFAGKPDLLAEPTGRRWYDMIQAGNGGDAALEIISSFSQGTFPEALMYLPGTKSYRSAWQETIDAAEEANDPGRFTSFIGYEWTSNTAGNNLHRVVIFRDDGERAGRVVPKTTYPPHGSDNPRDLWTWMQDYEDRTGGDVLAIAHNGNLSNGRMFEVIESFTGRRMDRDYAATRANWEPLYEVTQIKGDGETHPFLSPNDEFADYETWDKGNLDLSTLKTDDMLQYEYARSALKLGLQLESELGVNPFQFGMIGSTDSHTALATAEEDNFFGKASNVEPSAERMTHPFIHNNNTTVMTWETCASGYAAVWAEENTREAIFDAMERRETYATTGSRMIVRFFGGWEFTEADTHNRLPANIGYRKGVPMGGELTPRDDAAAPSFLIAALKDPIGANLDRLQVVKGWLDGDDELHERIYDVAVSDGRAIGPDGRCRVPVGDTVDAETASWANTIGDPELIAVWSDPDFSPDERAFYYVRVLEIPTPRWSTYDAAFYGIDIPEGAPVSQQDRAYTSPIWYSPEN